MVGKKTGNMEIKLDNFLELNEDKLRYLTMGKYQLKPKPTHMNILTKMAHIR